MSHSPFALLSVPVILALSLSLAGCGSNHTVCALANSRSTSTCGCGATPSAQACPVNPPPEFLYATSSTGNILGFPIDSETGALGAETSVAGPTPSLGLISGTDSTGTGLLYASDFQTAELYGYSINSTTGALTPLASSPFSTGTLSVPVGLSLGLQADFLYVADVGKIDAYTVTPATGLLTPITGSPFTSATNTQVLVSPSGQFLYAADLGPSNSIYAFTIGADGSLTAVVGSPFSLPGQNGTPNSILLGLATAFGGKFLYATIGETNQVAGFSIDGTTGALTSVPGSPFATGTQPTFMAVANSLIYAVNTRDKTVSAYTVDETSGTLSPVTGSPFPVDATAGLAINALGTLLYAAAPAMDQISAYSINLDGTLTPLSGSPFPTTGAALLTIYQMPF